MTASSSCWYQNLELQDIFKTKRSSVSKKSGPPCDLNSSNNMTFQSGVHRRRAKSTSAEEVDDSDFRRRLRSLKGCSWEDCSSISGATTNDTFNNNLNAIDGVPVVPNRPVNLLTGKRELLSSINSKRNDNLNSSSFLNQEVQFYKIMNAVWITSVYLLGAFSVVFLVLCYNNGSISLSGGGARKAMFQPFPQVEQLQVTDEGYLNSKTYPSGPDFDDEDNECDGENKLGLELEAISSVHAALEMKENGKMVKAQKLFQHAMALCPRHADVLTNYGEFFEDARQDFTMADHLYVQALTYNPSHIKALINRKRTLPVVEDLDERRMKRIDEKRDQLLQLPDTNRALKRIKKEAYFQHIYHSAGIEGNTMTLHQTRMIVETRMAVGGKSIIEHNEILGLDAALKFINSSLVNRIGKITIKDILLVHKHLMGFVDPEEAGQFRRTQVFVGNHIPPGPDEMMEQMTQLVDWLNSEEALSLHPIHYAAIAHYKLVYVHPFVDGNGRTSRLLMNWILMQANYPPVIIRKQDRHLYYEHLNTANKGDIRPFIRFIGDCTEKTMDVYLWATQEHYPILELEDEAEIGRDRSPGS